MKNIALALLGLSLSQITNAQDLKEFEWLVGSWERQGGRPGTSSVEVWSLNDDGSLSGSGITMKGGDTVFVEKLHLVIKNNKPHYVAEVAHNKSATYFEIIESSNSGFVSSNPEHDFPKKIKYDLDGNKLVATISGNGKEIPFHFIRKDQN